jgi:hypothetical protein
MADMRTRRYEIIVSGRLGVVGHEAFGDLHIEPRGADTALTGDLNRSGLHDVLARIRDLASDLVGLTCLAPGPGARRQTEAAARQGSAAQLSWREPCFPAAD